MRSVAVRLALATGLAAITGCSSAPSEVGGIDQAITNGTLATGDTAVVGLVSGQRITCSGVVIASRVVVTAAHCLVANTVDAVALGADLASATRIAVVHASVHPAYDPRGLEADLGLLLLASPVATQPAPRFPISLDASDVGRDVQLVGFGQTAPGDTSVARKRRGLAMLASFDARTFQVAPRPSLTCGGDSGGAALLEAGGTTYVAGIVSAGDAGCAQFSRSTRLDAYAAFIDDFVARTEAGAAAPGERCYDAASCDAARCVFPADAPTIGYCAADCASDRDCATGMTCIAEGCRYPSPSPGALGAPCTTYDDCDSRLCAGADARGTQTCAIACELASPRCPDDFECRADNVRPATHACFRRPEDPGGCATSRPAPGWLVLVLLLIRRSRAGGSRRARRYR